MVNYAKDLHRKGELHKVEAMERLAKSIERKTNEGLVAAFVTKGWLGCDAFCIIANDKKYEHEQGAVLYDEDEQKAIFILDEDD